MFIDIAVKICSWITPDHENFTTRNIITRKFYNTKISQYTVATNPLQQYQTVRYHMPGAVGVRYLAIYITLPGYPKATDIALLKQMF